MIILLKCEICPHEVATVDTEKLKMPIRGSMFGAPEVWHISPFHADVDWQYMRCPMCRKRPFIKEGEFTTADGRWMRVLKDGSIDLPVIDKPMGDQFGDVIEGSEESNAIDAAWSQKIESTKPCAEHECGETGLALMEDGEGLAAPGVKKAYPLTEEDIALLPELPDIVAAGEIKVYVGAEFPDLNEDSGKPVAVIPINSKKKITVADEMMRLHGLGMRPGEISRELKDKAKVEIHHLQIAKKIRTILKAKEATA
jgi:hypothetical protein